VLLDMKNNEKSVVLEDIIMQKGIPITSSKILNGFKPLINATVVTRLTEKDYKIIGNTSVNEFGINFFLDDEPGAFESIESGAAEFALCNDIFGHYRKNAPKKNCCYIHPSYGTVSRYGLIPAATSMDQVGVLCKDITSGLTLISHISGNDPKDGAMLPDDFKKQNRDIDANKIRIGVPDTVLKNAADASCDAVNSFAEKFEKVSIELKYSNVYSSVMTILSCAEISCNINRYDGIKYGKRAADFRGIDDLYIKTRSVGFGINAKFAACMGGLVLSQDNYDLYYDKAMKIRRLIKESLLFDKYDIIALPCDIGVELSALAGFPSCSFSYGGEGVQLIANVCGESLFNSVKGA
jgi:aspartyl-tRNA(Asn)/glutamyl-tRNA(Gln) amidotransferase subunit A